MDLIMKVLKFSEFIEEGFLSKTLGRSKSGDLRLEDKFTKSDFDEFCDDVESDINGVRIEYDVHKLSSDLQSKLSETYDKFLETIIKKHEIKDITFKTESKINIPDFDYTYNIEKLKNVRLHITIDGKTKEVNMYLGNNKDEFKLCKESGKNFENELLNVIYRYPRFFYSLNLKLMVFNIENNWDKFSQSFYQDCFDFYLDRMRKKGLADISKYPIYFDDDMSYGLIDDNKFFKYYKDYFISDVDVSNDIVLIDTFDISDKELNKKITTVIHDAYDSAYVQVENERDED